MCMFLNRIKFISHILFWGIGSFLIDVLVSRQLAILFFALITVAIYLSLRQFHKQSDKNQS